MSFHGSIHFLLAFFSLFTIFFCFYHLINHFRWKSSLHWAELWSDIVWGSIYFISFQWCFCSLHINIKLGEEGININISKINNNQIYFIQHNERYARAGTKRCKSQNNIMINKKKKVNQNQLHRRRTRISKFITMTTEREEKKLSKKRQANWKRVMLG